MEIIPGIHQIKLPLKDNPLGYINTYLVHGTDGWVLIDAGWNDQDSFDALSSQMADIGLSLKDIVLIIVTHIHPDHLGMAGRIQQLSDAKLALHELEKAFIDSREEWAGNLLEDMNNWLRLNGVPEDHLPQFDRVSSEALGMVAPAVADRGIRHGESISTGTFDLEALWTPGHSPGHLCLYERKSRLLFTGDHVLPVTTPNISIHMEWHADPLGEYLKSLEAIRYLDVQLNLPAHEEVFANLAGRIDQLLEHHAARKKEIVETIRSEAKTAFQISSEITWMEGTMTWDDLALLDRRIAVTEALAHLEALRGEHRVERFVNGGLARYRAV